MLALLPPLSSLRHAFWWSLAATAYSAAVVGLAPHLLDRWGDLPAGLEAVLSLAIGLLLAFRVNRAFERWWEGRTLWGQLVNASRNLAVKANNLIQDDDPLATRIRRLVVAYPRVLRDHLRGGATAPALDGLPAPAEPVAHAPSWVVNQLYGVLEALKRGERVQYGDFRVIDRDAKVLLEVCGGCERIRNTPIAASYRALLMQAVALFLVTLPWGLAHSLGTATVPVMFFTSYFVLAAEAIAEHVEQPFGERGDALDLDTLCQAVESSVEEVFRTPTAAHNPE